MNKFPPKDSPFRGLNVAVTPYPRLGDTTIGIRLAWVFMMAIKTFILTRREENLVCRFGSHRKFSQFGGISLQGDNHAGEKRIPASSMCRRSVTDVD